MMHFVLHLTTRKEARLISNYDRDNNTEL
jgi:hypothetical protein